MEILILSQNSFVEKIFWRFYWLERDTNRISAKFRHILMSRFKDIVVYLRCLWKYSCSALVQQARAKVTWYVKGDKNIIFC